MYDVRKTNGESIGKYDVRPEPGSKIIVKDKTWTVVKTDIDLTDFTIYIEVIPETA